MRYSKSKLSIVISRGAAAATLASLLFTVGITDAAPAAAQLPESSVSVGTSELTESASIASSLAQANSGSDFDPGFIISNDLFYQSDAMTQAQIQTFLESKLSSCSNSNCLTIKTTTTYSRDADRTVCKAYEGASNELTSAIIYKVQEACGISAKVLLVTLQKEQGLITNSAPSDSRLARAMGYGCPDNTGGVCDAEYYGLYNQLYHAAWQLKRYSTPTPWGYYQPGVKSIQYHPNTACGTKTVTIKNNATAALYNYTPYVPNSAALANLGGYGDSCSSYGNRNFWDYYTSWFGSTNAASGDTEIAAAYAETGSASGPLGAAVAATSCGTASSCWQEFAHGVIYWTRAGGAVVVSGVEGDRYLELGGVAGVLGAPRSAVSPYSNDTNGDGEAQIFANGNIYTSVDGSFAVWGEFKNVYTGLGWIRGNLGWPTSELQCTGERCSQSFQGGSIHQVDKSSGVFAISDPSIVSYVEVSSAGLGFPTLETHSFDTVNGNGLVQPFSKGYVYSSSAGVFTVPSSWYRAYADAGWIRGSLGWPAGEQVCESGSCSQKFQNGSLYQASPTSAITVVHGIAEPTIAEYYETRSTALGQATLATHFFDTVNGSGAVQPFSKGYVYSSSAGVFTVPSSSYRAYADAGWIRGSLGWPAGEAVCEAGTCTQQFQHGLLSAAY